MKMKFLMLIPIMLVGIVCKEDKAKGNKSSVQQTAVVQNLNISFLLDLSDRIDPKKHPKPTMEYYQRDVQYINSVKKAFLNHIKKKKIIHLNDQMQVFFDPEPENPQINLLSQKLKVGLSKSSSKSSISEIDKTFSEIPLKIYQSAIKDNQYIGSDIWRFFKNKVHDYCIKDRHRNILVIITDGYMYHKNSAFLENNKSSYLTPEFIQSKKLASANYKAVIEKSKLGFIPATSKLENLEIIVLGINPSKKNPYEEEVIHKFWTDWFISMDVKKFHLKSADLPTDLDPIIQKIISGK